MKMKNMLVAAAVVSAFASLSQAAVIVDDSFSYPDGSLNGQDAPIGGVWNNHSGTAGQVQVAGGQITLVQSGQSEDVNVPFEGGVSAGAGAVLTASFDLTVPAITAPVASVYFAQFLAGTSSFDARVWMTAPVAGGYRLALSNDNSITDGDGEVFTGDLAFGTTYRITTVYDYSAKTGSLSINGGAALLASDPGFSDAVTAYAFREASGNTSQIIDNLTVSMVVPEPATLGVLAGLGVIGLRRRATR